MFPKQSGLSAAEAQALLQQHGQNRLPEKPPPSDLVLFIRQFKNPLIYVLLIATALTLLIQDYSDAAIISVAVFMNAILGFVQERKASHALHALKQNITATVTVMREQERQTIDVSQLVPGDIVILDQGTKVPADGVLLHANRLHLDESVLTGESASVKKEHNEEVYMGTTVASGQGVMKVEHTGASTKMGRIALQIQEQEEDTPLQLQLKGLSKQLVWIIGILTAGVFVLGLLYKFSLLEVFTTSIALAVSSIPEGLTISLTVVLAVGMQRILKRRGLVRKLVAAETLGGVTVVCVDKTGTLTQGKMRVVDHIGDKTLLAEQAVLANDLDDPLVLAAFAWGRDVAQKTPAQYQRLDSIPFSSKERFFMSLHAWNSQHHKIFVNGAPEQVLQWTTLSQAEKKEVMRTIDTLTKEGKRLIGYASKEVPHSHTSLMTKDAKHDLTWVGLIAFSDPVRAGVKEALEQAKLAGIQIMVITGDYAKTSEYVLNQLGISVQEHQVVTGERIEFMDDQALSGASKGTILFARSTPEHKLRIVDALRKNGEVVAMMGDGVNDAPALHRADIGIAVGEATDVAKESADLVLLDSNFATIVASIEEGRGMFENIRKIVLYLMSDAFAEILLVVGAMVMGLPLPVTAAQILWINVISDGFPGLALTIDPKRDGIMLDGPRSTKERLISSWMIKLMAVVSGVAGLVSLASFAVVYVTTGDLVMARSMGFITLGLSTLVYVFSVRTLSFPFWKTNIFQNGWLVAAAIAGVLLQLLPFALEELRSFFGIQVLPLGYWVAAMILAAGTFSTIEVFKVVFSNNNKMQ